MMGALGEDVVAARISHTSECEMARGLGPPVQARGLGPAIASSHATRRSQPSISISTGVGLQPTPDVSEYITRAPHSVTTFFSAVRLVRISVAMIARGASSIVVDLSGATTTARITEHHGAATV